ncbi:limbic system-associated membrane protein-like protein [Willisornis vidua]|uniref:Limbic system-associated membrane protein-like protein n=1 Tax=Willisornis vidua TaxID=1566151 RepID=A0ABQ9DLD6_9PASS|nr:limbic system-associated membrane protein-like protein [Willisornis vidua]
MPALSGSALLYDKLRQMGGVRSLCPPEQVCREFEGEEEYLEILGITREQSGKYECKAANEVASADVKQVRVTVNYPPTITESKSNEAATGRQALLRCEASAVPTPDFEWYRDDTRINSANGLEIKSTGTQSLLMVANVTEEHYGNYTCVAANKLGVTNASLYLYSPKPGLGLDHMLLLPPEIECSKMIHSHRWTHKHKSDLWQYSSDGPNLN